MQEEVEEGGGSSAPTELAYYYMNDVSGAARGGPCTASQLRVLWMSGYISRGTLTWRDGMDKWTAISESIEVRREQA